MKKMKILIVDDDMFNQEVLELRLEVFDFEIEIFDNGKEALEYVKSHDNIDFIFMDINMPIMSGDEATRLIREYEKESSKKRIPIIAVGASINASDRKKLLKIGMDEIITSNTEIANSGKSGLALGDHLHFGILVQGVEVRPEEWMDNNWINTNIKDIIKSAKKLIDGKS